MRAGGGAVAVLPADGDAAAGERLGHQSEVGKRWADQQVAGKLGAFGASLERAGERPGIIGQTVHLPVSGNQGSHRRSSRQQAPAYLAQGPAGCTWGKTQPPTQDERLGER